MAYRSVLTPFPLRQFPTIFRSTQVIYHQKIFNKLRYLIKKFPPCPHNCYITCSGKTDGIGAQVQAVLSTMLFAYDMGITYVHTPFKTIAHNTERDPQWEQKWESFFSLGKGEIALSHLPDTSLDIVPLEHPRKLQKKANTLYVLPHCHDYADLFPERYSALYQTFYKKISSRPEHKYEQHHESNTVNVAVHVRRGDVSKHGSDAFRYTENSYVASLLKNLQKILESIGVKPLFNIYSQGHVRDFCELQGIDIDFHLNLCTFQTFHNLASADILVMSKSSLSYSAALFSRGIKIYEPFWHNPPPDWIVADNAGKFSKTQFKKKYLSNQKLPINKGLPKNEQAA